MRRAIANTFFTINFLSALASVAISLVDWINPMEASTKILINSYGVIELLLTLPFLYIVGSNKKLPARTYMPLFLLYLFPLFLLDETMKAFLFVLSLVALSLSLYAGQQRRKITGHKLGLIPKNFFQKEDRKRVRGLFLSLAMIPILSINLVGAFYIESRNSQDENLLGGISFKIDGIYTKLQTYEKEGRRAIVIGMMHIGDGQFYRQALSEAPTVDTLVLREGIMDRNEKLGTSDPIAFASATLNKPRQGESFEAKIGHNRKTINADLDISDMSESAASYYINLTHQNSIFDGVSKPLEEREAAKEAAKKFMLERNQNLLKTFDANESHYQTLVFAWGAGHSEYVSKALIERGYTLVSEKEMRAFSFFSQEK